MNNFFLFTKSKLSLKPHKKKEEASQTFFLIRSADEEEFFWFHRLLAPTKKEKWFFEGKWTAKELGARGGKFFEILLWEKFPNFF